MSHDLRLFPALDRPPLERDAFLAACEGDHFTTEDDQASYSNEETGVYFSLTWYPGGDEDEDEEGEERDPNRTSHAMRSRPHVHFNMNYCRPHFFGLEADVELSGLARRLSLRVHDDQGDE